jgi:hypothetical protein
MFNKKYMEFLLERRTHYQNIENETKSELSIFADKELNFENLLKIRELYFKRELQLKEIEEINKLIDEQNKSEKTKKDVYSYIDTYFWNPGDASNEMYIKSSLKDIDNVKGFFNTTLYIQTWFNYHKIFVKDLFDFIKDI